MTRRGRVSKLEAARPVPVGAVRVIITRQIIGGGATASGEDWQARPVQVVRREVLLYPDGLPRPPRGPQ